MIIYINRHKVNIPNNILYINLFFYLLNNNFQVIIDIRNYNLDNILRNILYRHIGSRDANFCEVCHNNQHIHMIHSYQN
jgi:hypothetical protein